MIIEMPTDKIGKAYPALRELCVDYAASLSRPLRLAVKVVDDETVAAIVWGCGRIYAIHTVEHRREMGIAKELVNYASALSNTSLSIKVPQDNIVTMCCFLKLGFTIYGKFKHIDHPQVDYISMVSDGKAVGKTLSTDRHIYKDLESYVEDVVIAMVPPTELLV